MENKQIQKSGDNSQQIQAETIIVNTGIDEKRAREIFDEKFAIARQDYANEALAVVNARIKRFECCLIPKIVEIDKGLEAFADPSFQFLLLKAQKSAASTERPADYDLLSELLTNRIQNGGNRKIRAGINRAVEIVEDISDDALLGLTVFHSVSFFRPISGNIHDGLDILNNLFGKIIYGELPVGQDWLDHLDVLDAVRINSFGSINKIQAIYPVALEGYVAVGIKKDSEEYIRALEILNKAGLNPMDILMQHVLNSDYVRINIPQKATVDTLNFNIITVVNNNPQTLIPLSDSQKKAIASIYELYQNDATTKEQNIQKFMTEWDKRPNLKILREWWDNLPSLLIEITSVGKALAHANAQRCDNNLPSLN